VKNKIYIIILSVVFSILIWGSITLSDQFYSSMDFTVKVVNQPSGYSSGVIAPDKISLKMKAKGWQLLTLALGSQTEYLVSADKDSGVITVDPFNEIDENYWLSKGLSITEINPRQVSFKVEKVKVKRLKIEAETDISFSNGYGLATPIKIYPDSVLVSGPSSVLDNISTIKTKVLRISSLDNKIKIIADIDEPQGFQLEENKAELTIDVQRIVEKTFEDIKITIEGMPNDRDILLIPNTIHCGLSGGINILGKVNPNEISASIDYKDIVYDSLGSLQPKIVIPQNTRLIFIKPARLNYIIKKFE